MWFYLIKIIRSIGKENSIRVSEIRNLRLAINYIELYKVL